MKKIIQGEATITLMGVSHNAERFMKLLDKDLIVGAKMVFQTVELETIEVDVFEILQLQWQESEEEVLI